MSELTREEYDEIYENERRKMTCVNATDIVKKINRAIADGYEGTRIEYSDKVFKVVVLIVGEHSQYQVFHKGNCVAVFDTPEKAADFICLYTYNHPTQPITGGPCSTAY